MRKLLLATHNPHKKREILALLKDLPIDVMTLDDLGDQDQVIEDGDTFFDNAFKKACYFSKKYHMMTLADDSGLCVHALEGRPGVHSARFSNQGDKQNNHKLLFLMDKHPNRQAHFVSCLVLCLENQSPIVFEGILEGLIAEEAQGSNGFGYDPIFYVPAYGMTLAQMDMAQKNQLSHRAIALQRLMRWFNETFNHE